MAENRAGPMKAKGKLKENSGKAQDCQIKTGSAQEIPKDIPNKKTPPPKGRRFFDRDT